jgi:hypothetical protein
VCTAAGDESRSCRFFRSASQVPQYESPPARADPVFDGNPLMRLVTGGDFAPIQQSAQPSTKFEADAIAAFKAGSAFFSRLDRVGPAWVD